MATQQFENAALLPSKKEVAVQVVEETLKLYEGIALSGRWNREMAVLCMKEIRNLIHNVQEAGGITKGCLTDRLAPAVMSMNALRSAFSISSEEIEQAQLPWVHPTGRLTAMNTGVRADNYYEMALA